MAYFTFDSQRLFYREKGCGPLLIILPGNTASSTCHQDDVTYFSRNFHAVSLDYLGTGQSDRIESFGPNWYENCGDQVAGLIRHLEEEKAILIGTSGGAVVALQTAVRHPGLIQAVVADSFTPIFTQEMLENNVIRERSIRSEGQIAFWRFAHGPDWERVVDADTDMLKRLTQSGGQWLGSALETVTCPIFLSASLEDRLLAHPARFILEMLQKLPDGRAFLSAKGGHPLIWTAPEEFRTAIQGFLAQFLEK